MAKKKKKVSANKVGVKRKPPPHAWRKGQSGNPKGRKTDKELKEIRDLLRPIIPTSVTRLRKIIKTSKNEAAVIKAIELLYDRVYGKVPMTLAGAEDKPIRIDIKHAFLSRIDGLVAENKTD